MLYPYRASAQKNQVRWQFGVLVPPGSRDEPTPPRTRTAPSRVEARAPRCTCGCGSCRCAPAPSTTPRTTRRELLDAASGTAWDEASRARSTSSSPATRRATRPSTSHLHRGDRRATGRRRPLVRHCCRSSGSTSRPRSSRALRRTCGCGSSVETPPPPARPATAALRARSWPPTPARASPRARSSHNSTRRSGRGASRGCDNRRTWPGARRRAGRRRPRAVLADHPLGPSRRSRRRAPATSTTPPRSTRSSPCAR